jgi:hypothetical protein
MLLQYGRSQLARQHRYVVKDQLHNYDYFLAMEDDMYVSRQHINYQLEWMKRLRQWTKLAKERERNDAANTTTASASTSTSGTHFFQHRTHNNNNNDWQHALTSAQLERLRPGFIRVEVLQSPLSTPPLPDGNTIILPSNSVTTSIEQRFDPTICCQRPNRTTSSTSTRTTTTTTTRKKAKVLQSTDLVIWESGILGLGVRQIPDSHSNSNSNSNSDNPWVALLPGPRAKYVVPQYWTGNLLLERAAATAAAGTTSTMQRPSTSTPHFMAQSAGWMGSRREVLDYHTKLCTGASFLPPFDPPEYQQDGFFRNNVEYWSGGIQLWGMACNIQRFVVVESPKAFSHHLLYHTSNNKQTGTKRRKETDKFQPVLATTLLAQLRTVVEHQQQKQQQQQQQHDTVTETTSEW